MTKKVSLFLAVVFTICCSMTNIFALEYGEEYKNQPKKSYAQKFKDVDENYWAFSYISEMNTRGVIDGYPDGNYYPEEPVTRAEFAKIMTCAASMSISAPQIQRFDDAPTYEWYAPYIEAAYPFLSGYVYGDSSYYRPDAFALREDIAIALVKLKGYPTTGADISMLSRMFTDSSSISTNAQVYVATAVERGLISGYEDGTFRGQESITRSEAATMLWRAYQYGDDNKVVADNTTPTETKKPVETTKPVTDDVKEPTKDDTVSKKDESKTDDEPKDDKNEKDEKQDNSSKDEIDNTQKEPEKAPEPIKPYKIEKIVKANVKEAYQMAYDDDDNIYYVDTKQTL